MTVPTVDLRWGASSIEPDCDQAPAVRVVQFDELPERQATELLLGCARVRWWAQEVVARRPFEKRVALLNIAADLMGRWSWADVAAALAATPRIGRLPLGGGTTPSRSERSGLDEALTAELRAVDNAYEQRFGRALLVRRADRSTSEILRIGARRILLDEQADRAATTMDLRGLTRQRLRELII